MFDDYKRTKNIKFIRIKIVTFITAFILSTIFIILTTASSPGLNKIAPEIQNDVISLNKKNEIEMPDTIVISDSGDPYYPLAQDIAKSENAVFINSVKELYGFYPKYLIWVASPDFLSEKKLLELGEFFKKTRRFPAAGIITGLTIESAANLWERGNLAREGVNYIASDIDLDGGIENGVIINVSTQSSLKTKLDKENLINALENADYFYWARHVSDERWFWHKNSKGEEEYDSLYAEDIPDLKPVIIHTPSCGSFFPWVNNSIAMGFIEKGASAYLGDLFSPITSGIFIGNLNYLPGQYTWKDFPIGIVAQIQNRSTSRICTNTPIFFMMGNPKISLQSQKPYEIISDQEYSNKRIIKGRWENEGILPLKIDGGASYSYIKIKELSSVSENDLFYNSKIQSVNIQSDKYLLFIPDCSEFEIELSEKSPFLWNFFDSIKDSFEYSWITIGVVEGYISLVFLGIFLLIFLIYKLKKKISLKTYLPPIIAGFILAVLQLIFIIFQADKVTASSYIKIYPAFKLALGFMGTFSTVSGGLILMLASRKKILKILGMIICILPQFMLAVFYFLSVTIINLQFGSLGFPSLWNYSMVYQFSIVLVIEILIFICLYFIFSTLLPVRTKDKQVYQKR
jgi:hypothetical protein